MSLGEGNDNPLQYSCLEKNPVDRGAWQATVHGVAELGMTEQLSIDTDRQAINTAWHIGLRRCTQKHLSMTSGHTWVTFSKSES